jgi:glycosyltransferase involved in cell wall biosynthesis
MISNQNVEIGILLAAYNGEKYISEQLDSLVAQTYSNWKLYIRDDGSTDKTVSIINDYAKKDNRISIVKDDKKNLGSAQNFGTLINLVTHKFEYIMFCDQDDYWLPFKIEETLLQMQQHEASFEEEVPVLVYTNFKYVDSSLKEISSKKHFQAVKVPKLAFAQLLAQNPVYGCTMMLNKRLAAIVDVIPPEAENHDYWVALVAGALGKISYLNKQTIFYRQHSSNISTNFDSSSFGKRLKRIVFQRKNFEDAKRKIQMALAFKAAYYSHLKDEQKAILLEFIKFATEKKLGLLVRNIRNGVRRQTLAQTVLFYLSIMLLKKRN